MSTEIAVRTNGHMTTPDIAGYEAEQLDLIKKTVAVGATDLELRMFLTYAKRTGLDPIGRQIHCIKRGDKATIQVSIDGLRLIADRTGAYCGNDDAVFEGTTQDGNPARARVTVYKLVQGVRCAFTGSARWEEYAQKFTNRQTGAEYYGDLWRKMPHTMLAKCAESQALRKAFPADMSGIYTHEEMQQADAMEPAPRVNVQTGEVIEAQPVAQAAPKRTKRAALADLQVTDGWRPDPKDKIGTADMLSNLLAEPITPDKLTELSADDIDMAREELEKRNAQRARYYAVRAEIFGAHPITDEDDRRMLTTLLHRDVTTRTRINSTEWALAADRLPEWAQSQAAQTVPAAATVATVDPDPFADE